MADTTISSSDPRRLYDRDDTTLTSGPPPKKTTSSSTDAQPTLTGPTAYDVKDVAKHMPVTTMELSLDAQKAAVDKRLASPTDYPKRKYDEALRDDLARRILDRDTQAKAAAKEAQCPSWAACQPVPKWDGGWKPSASSDPKDGTHQATASGSDDGGVRVGFVDVKSTPGQKETTVGVARAQDKSTTASGVTVTTTRQVGTIGAHQGVHNADGSTGLNAGSGAALVNEEVTVETKEGASVTLGAAVGESLDGSIGVKDGKHGIGRLACARADLGPVTVGACVPAGKPEWAK